MPGAFIQTAAPNGAPWEQLLRAAPPSLDPNGFVSGPWGECLHYAVVFETQNPGWDSMPQYQDAGPAGQVIDFAGECGFGGFSQALDKNEQQTKANLEAGNQNFCFQGMQPQPTQYGQPQYGGMMPPQQQMMGGVAPAGMVMAQAMPMGAPGQQFMQVDPYQILGTLPMVHVEEKMNLLETAAGLLGEMLGVDMELEMANKYVIKTPQGHPLFFAVEQTDFCNRQFGADCRAIDIDVVVLGQDPRLMQQATGDFDWSFNPFGGALDLNGSQKFMHMHKDCQFTCCCFNRPIIDVINGTNGQVIGKIKDPWACCDMTFDMMDQNMNPTLTAKGGCCQLGLLCPCPCGPCREVKFDVNDAKTGQPIASLKKVVPDCLKFLAADDVDNYEVEFGNVSDPQWKAMLVALALFIDFRYFNVRSDKNDGGGGDGDGGDGGDGGGDG
eukprot:gnl/TRDRNA2_/TRDRNA2_38748_c0_seq1.p1 gnl/TRDRNA2_/TRDRNA2_38748_c0~~gnl/TRDRNA2_/TRDRNA2_38748_c0_seq1.p1  ORF type:complete len:440 (-),score=91.31 gnl/TRDRNA2_/TRDRNA2_38748_c0_seq1:363-1682(-)